MQFYRWGKLVWPVGGFVRPAVFREVVRGTGLEPARLSPYAPQTYVSANSTTRAPYATEQGYNYMESPGAAS